MFAVRTRKDVALCACKTQNRRQKFGSPPQVPSHVSSILYMTPEFLRIILQGKPFLQNKRPTAYCPFSKQQAPTTSAVLQQHQIATAQLPIRSDPTSTIHPRPTRQSYLPCFVAEPSILQIISSRRRRALQLFIAHTRPPPNLLGRI